MKTRTTLIATILSAFIANPLLIGNAQAQDFSNLTNRSTKEAANELNNNGYSHIHTEQSGSDKWDYWWNANSQDCVVGHTQGWNYQTLHNSTKLDCEKYADSKGSDNKAALGAAAGVAALVGIAALIHHNKHKNDSNNDNNDNYNNNYSNYDNNGYDNDRYSNNQNWHDNHHQQGYYVKVADLIGIKASSGESELENRGFVNLDGSKGWHRSYTTWWNEDARECVEVTTRDGRYSNVHVVSTSACA